MGVGAAVCTTIDYLLAANSEGSREGGEDNDWKRQRPRETEHHGSCSLAGPPNDTLTG